MGLIAFLKRLFGRKSAKQAKPVAASKASKKTAKTPAKKVAAKKTGRKAKAAAKTLQAQCAALTASGGQCKNSSRGGSKYCGSHKGYQPPARGKAHTSGKNTAPKVAGAKDTAAAARRPAGTARCGAKTAAGTQCKRDARDGSKYCTSHKGYRPAAKTAAKPAAKKAAKKAPAKKPAAKKAASRTQVTKHGYKLFKNGNRYFFSKKSGGDVKGNPVYTMPADRTVVRTPNGLPVLKKK